jgi:hypothetical protein
MLRQSLGASVANVERRRLGGIVVCLAGDESDRTVADGERLVIRRR